jgi:hypothetical protein
MLVRGYGPSHRIYRNLVGAASLPDVSAAISAMRAIAVVADEYSDEIRDIIVPGKLLSKFAQLGRTISRVVFHDDSIAGRFVANGVLRPLMVALKSTRADQAVVAVRALASLSDGTGAYATD